MIVGQEVISLELKGGGVVEGVVLADDGETMWLHSPSVGDVAIARWDLANGPPKPPRFGIYARNVSPQLRAEAPKSHIRYLEGDDEQEGKLQTAVTRWVHPKTGNVMFLVGAVHVGDGAYYDQLQTILDNVDLVLFEGVGGGAAKVTEEEKASFDVLFRFQMVLKDILGMEFQTQHMDYTRKHFKRADTDLSSLKAVMKEKKVSLPTDNKLVRLLLRVLLGFMDTDSVKKNPALQSMLRSRMAPMLADADKLMEKMGGGLQAVLIDYRNEVAMKVLEEELQGGRKNDRLALFYGAAHLPDFAQRLGATGWSCQGTDWVTAWGN